MIASDLISSSNESKSNSSPYILLNLETAEFAAIWISFSVTSSPFIDPNEPVNAVWSEPVPRKTKGTAHTSTTNISLGRDLYSLY